MSADEHDPIADTAMFRAYFAQGEGESTQRRRINTPVTTAILIVLVAAGVMIWLLVR